MKKMGLKRTGLSFTKPKDLLKPFDFCCDINHQDQDTHYNTRIPPIVTSLTNISPRKNEGPDLKFRLQDVGKPTSPTQRTGTHKVKSSTQMSRGKRGRGPLLWYIEDEIALARDIIAVEREEKCKREKQIQRDLLEAKKNKKRARKSKNRKYSEEANKASEDNRKEPDKEEEEE